MGDKDSNLVMITCPQHSRILAEGLYSLLLDEQETDLELKYYGWSAGVHKMVMGIFLSPENERKKFLRRRNDQNPLDSLLEFMYIGRLAVPKDQLDGLLKVAKQFEFEILVEAIKTACRQGGEAISSIDDNLSLVSDASCLSPFDRETFENSTKDYVAVEEEHSHNSLEVEFSENVLELGGACSGDAEDPYLDCDAELGNILQI